MIKPTPNDPDTRHRRGTGALFWERRQAPVHRRGSVLAILCMVQDGKTQMLRVNTVFMVWGQYYRCLRMLQSRPDGPTPPLSTWNPPYSSLQPIPKVAPNFEPPQKRASRLYSD